MMKDRRMNQETTMLRMTACLLALLASVSGRQPPRHEG
jgi:hypothetical protein